VTRIHRLLSGPTFASLRVRNYRLFAAGAVATSTGTWMQRVAQDWLVLQLTSSGAALGITTGLQFLPMLLFSPWAGILADRFPKRQLLMVTQTAMGLSAALLGVLAIAEVATEMHVYAIALLFGTAAAFDQPARQAFVNEMVGPALVANAVGLNSSSFNLARMIGPAAAGAMIAALGSDERATGWVILLTAVGYIVTLYTLTRLNTDELHPPPLLPRAKGQLTDAIRYVRSRPDIVLVLGVVFCAGTFGLNFQLTTALMATEVYGKGAGEYGILGSVLAIGSLAGGLVAARRGTSRQRLVILSALAFGAAEVVVGLMPSYLTFALFLPVCGFAGLTMVTAANSFVQMSTDAVMRGRVMALYMMIFMGGTPIGAPVLGWVADHFGARWTLIGGGGLTALGTIAVVLLTSGRQGIVPADYLRPHLTPTAGD